MVAAMGELEETNRGGTDNAEKRVFMSEIVAIILWLFDVVFRG